MLAGAASAAGVHDDQRSVCVDHDRKRINKVAPHRDRFLNARYRVHAQHAAWWVAPRWSECVGIGNQEITGRVNERLRALGQTLASYIYEIVLYVTFHSDERPYPFGPWPQGAPGAKADKPRPPRKRKTPPAKPAEEGSAG